MLDGRIVVARLMLSYNGSIPSRAGIMTGLDKERFKTVIIYLTKRSDAPNYFEEQGCSVQYLFGNARLNAFRFSILRKLVKTIRQEKIDLIHCHRHKATVYAAIATFFAKQVKVISHVHGLNRSKKLRRKILNRFILQRVSRILTVGESVREDVLRANSFLPPENVCSIGNSIDIERFTSVDISKAQARQRLGLDQDSVVVGTVGRLTPTKGYDTLLHSFKNVKDRLSNAQLVFIGDGRLRTELEGLANELGLSECVSFLGRREDMPEVYKAMDIFVLSSIAEGMPRSLLEAMASEVLCVATDVGAIPEILDNGRFGLQVSSGDAAAMSDAIVKLEGMAQDDKDVLISSAKQRVVADYNHNVVIKRLEKIYREECV